ncbi:hypothetical protein Tco_0608789 [Tanacetum coccineum]
MELENTQNNALAKLPMLKLGEYEMWDHDQHIFRSLIYPYGFKSLLVDGNSGVLLFPEDSKLKFLRKLTAS